MFGSDTAFNLNSSLYCWNKDAKSIYIYFKTDSTASTAGSNFNAGTLALAGGGGLVAGAVLSVLTMNAAKKKREKALTA